MTSEISRALTSAAMSARSVMERRTEIPVMAARSPPRTSRSTRQVRAP